MARPKQDLTRVNFNLNPDLLARVKQFADDTGSTVTETVIGSLDLLLGLVSAWDNGCDVIIRAQDGSEAIVPLPIYGLARVIDRFSSQHLAPIRQ